MTYSRYNTGTSYRTILVASDYRALGFKGLEGAMAVQDAECRTLLGNNVCASRRSKLSNTRVLENRIGFLWYITPGI